MKACSCQAGVKCKSPGKHPKHKDWESTPPMSAADVQATWDVKLPANLGILTGEPSGFFVLDIDPDNGGLDSAKRLAAKHGPLPATRIVETGSGGWHYCFTMPDFPVTNANKWFTANGYPGIDIRGTGGMVVAPPSVSNKGAYKVVHNAEIAPPPGWLLDAIRPVAPAKPVVTAATAKAAPSDPTEAARLENYTRTITSREYDRLEECRRAAVPQGQTYTGPAWNQTVFEVSCTLIQLANSPWSTLSMQQAYAGVFEFAPRDPGFTDIEVNACFESARSRIGDKAREMPAKPAPAGPVFEGDPLSDPNAGLAGPTTPSAAPASQPGGEWPTRSWDDLGNAQRMVDHYGRQLRWIEQAGTWAVYEGGRWQMDTARLGHNLAQRMIESLPRTEALSYEDVLEGDDKETPRARFEKWVKMQRMSSKIAACLKETSGRVEMQARLTDFDTDPMLLNVANGVVDLSTGLLQPHDPDLMLMQQSPVVYDPAAKAPRWEGFLEEVMPSPDMRAYLQRICGYSLTGKMGEQAMFLHHGSGANGKSVFLQIATHIAGDYGQVVPRTTLLVQSGEEHPTSVARMVGKRFLQTSETAAGRRLDEEVVKGLTGGEKQTARYMAKDFFDFTPTGKIHYVTNHLPRLTDAESIWRRLHLIGWRVTIPAERRDPELADKIIASEASGVLTWMVAGAVAWANEGGLHRPVVSVVDLTDYREDQDEFGDFLRECLDLNGDEECRETTSAIYGAYTAWAWRSGIRSPLRRPDLARVLRERKIPEYRTSTERGFAGVRVLSQDSRPAAPKAGPAGIDADPLA